MGEILRLLILKMDKLPWNFYLTKINIWCPRNSFWFLQSPHIYRSTNKKKNTPFCPFRFLPRFSQISLSLYIHVENFQWTDSQFRVRFEYKNSTLKIRNPKTPVSLIKPLTFSFHIRFYTIHVEREDIYSKQARFNGEIQGNPRSPDFSFLFLCLPFLCASLLLFLSFHYICWCGHCETAAHLVGAREDEVWVCWCVITYWDLVLCCCETRALNAGGVCFDLFLSVEILTIYIVFEMNDERTVADERPSSGPVNTCTVVSLPRRFLLLWQFPWAGLEYMEDEGLYLLLCSLFLYILSIPFCVDFWVSVNLNIERSIWLLYFACAVFCFFHYVLHFIQIFWY